MNIHIILGTLLFALFPAFLFSQNITTIEEPEVEKMLARHVEINKNTQGMEGWRIQILATTDRMRMERVKNSFRARYPDISVGYIHEKPWYKVRAGAFLSKWDAIYVLHQLKQTYDGAYLTSDKMIKPSELIKN